jgi:hemoglobin-like flavoprotein
VSFGPVSSLLPEGDDINLQPCTPVSRLFTLDPTAQQVFSFGNDKEELTDAFFESERLKKHAIFFIQMIERVIGLLGPDIDLLTDILLELRNKHAAFGVQASHYPHMGQALLETIQALSGNKFTDDVKHSWLEVFQALSCDMVQAHNKRWQSQC